MNKHSSGVVRKQEEIQHFSESLTLVGKRGGIFIYPVF